MLLVTRYITTLPLKVLYYSNMNSKLNASSTTAHAHLPINSEPGNPLRRAEQYHSPPPPLLLPDLSILNISVRRL